MGLEELQEKLRVGWHHKKDMPAAVCRAADGMFEARMHAGNRGRYPPAIMGMSVTRAPSGTGVVLK